MQRKLLQTESNYTVSPKALKRWAEERLLLTQMKDGSIEAKFLYEGTTCANMGHPLAFQYHVRLSSQASKYTIEHMHCEPVEGDIGHKKMCEYIKTPISLMKQIKQEKPLLGQPLNDALEWNRPYSPEGCYCHQDSRTHKWGMVLETVHYALVQMEKSNEN